MKVLVVVAGGWAALVALIVLQAAPALPRNNLEWFLVLVAGPPLYVLGEGFFGWLFSPEHGRRISPKSFSLFRVMLALVVTLVLLGLGVLISFSFRSA